MQLLFGKHIRDVIVPISDRGWNCYELDSFPENNNLLW